MNQIGGAMRWRGRRLLAAASVGAALAIGTVSVGAASAPLPVDVLDRCDPATFNAVLGEGACIGDGDVTFEEFIAELEKKQSHNQWRFSPKNVSVQGGRDLFVSNVGGEFHTFTKVAEFGGGFVPELNELSGNPDPAPECFLPPSATSLFLGAGQSATVATGEGTAVPPGTNLFICCVHPWMRTTLTVK
jgi:hypothetical protein